MSNVKHLRIDVQGAVTLAELLDKKLIDRSAILELTDELLEYITNHRPAKLLVNFAEVDRFGTESINALLRARASVAAYGGEMRLCGMKDPIRQAFNILRLDGSVFRIVDAPSEAMELFRCS